MYNNVDSDFGYHDSNIYVLLIFYLKQHLKLNVSRKN